MTRTFSRADWEAAERAWSEGDYGWRWAHIRRIARGQGILFPPNGTILDDRDAESPSQRAIVWRALEDNPAELERIVRRSRSWSQVVDYIVGMEERLRREVGETEQDEAWHRADDPDHRQSVQALGAILERIESSR